MSGTRFAGWAWAAVLFASGSSAAQETEAPAPPAEAPRESTPAPEPNEHVKSRGVSFGLRAGYALPAGALTKGDPIRSNLTGMLPLWLDAGYRVSEPIYLGAYFQWAPAFVSDDVCPLNLSCSANDLRFGIDVHWHFKQVFGEGAWVDKFDPWVGLGTGYESTTFHLETPSGAASHETNHGFEYANLQLGFDHLDFPWHVGIFATFSLAEYIRRSHTVPTGTPAYGIPDPALHFWFMFGLRGQYDL
jgi:hypothetical protein